MRSIKPRACALLPAARCVRLCASSAALGPVASLRGDAGVGAVSGRDEVLKPVQPVAASHAAASTTHGIILGRVRVLTGHRA
jgi:hypothetical protein